TTAVERRDPDVVLCCEGDELAVKVRKPKVPRLCHTISLGSPRRPGQRFGSLPELHVAPIGSRRRLLPWRHRATRNLPRQRSRNAAERRERTGAGGSGRERRRGRHRARAEAKAERATAGKKTKPEREHGRQGNQAREKPGPQGNQARKRPSPEKGQPA